MEEVPDDEAEIQEGLTDAMLSIARKTYADEGHAYRAVHAKAHGYVRARFEVPPELPQYFAQGLFARPATYDALIRFSTTPGDILNDNVSMPRGVALKILGVPGARLEGSEDDETQNYVMGNSPSFQVGTAQAFLKQLKMLAATTGRGEPLKEAFSVASRTVEAALEKVGVTSATLVTLAGQAPTHLLGDTFYSQAALLHGDYYGKAGIFPVSPELTDLTESRLEVSGHPDAIRESIRKFFEHTSATWELRVQLANTVEKMPIEDASKAWPEEESPYTAVARITAPAQDSWSDELQSIVEDRRAFDPWIGLAAHRPLGSIMRARRPAYAAARAFRAQSNAVKIEETGAEQK